MLQFQRSFRTNIGKDKHFIKFYSTNLFSPGPKTIGYTLLKIALYSSSVKGSVFFNKVWINIEVQSTPPRTKEVTDKQY